MENKIDYFDPYDIMEYENIKKMPKKEYPSAVRIGKCYQRMKAEYDRRAKILKSLTNRGEC